MFYTKNRKNFVGIHSPIFFLSNVGDTMSFNSVDKMSHIFGPKLDIVSEIIIAFLDGKHYWQYLRCPNFFYFKYFNCQCSQVMMIYS